MKAARPGGMRFESNITRYYGPKKLSDGDVVLERRTKSRTFYTPCKRVTNDDDDVPSVSINTKKKNSTKRIKTRRGVGTVFHNYLI